MLDRLGPFLKVVCLVLAALLLAKIIQRALHIDPLGNAAIPPLPALTVEKEKTPNPPVAKESASSKTETNSSHLTNATAGTNAAAGTNLTTRTNLAATTNSTGANASTNGLTAAGARKRLRHGGGSPMPAGFPMAFGGPPPQVKLPGPIQSRVDRIRESEILGPVMHPMPMALLGIADDDAFLRGPDGQTGMIKEGGEIGGIKLLRIGINRVLVEENGEKKELTLFNGYGGESLLPQDTNSSTNASIAPKHKGNL